MLAIEILRNLIKAWNKYQEEGWNKNISRLLVDHQSVLQNSWLYKILANSKH